MQTNPSRRTLLVQKLDPVARSASSLGLRTDPRAATITSSGEVNTLTTSFSPTNPAWQGGSTSAVTVGGTYNGDQGTDTLEVVVTRVRANGRRDLSLRDGSGSEIERIVIGRNEPDGAPQHLSDGLTLSFSTRDMVVDDRFTVNVESTTPQAANPTGAFDLTGPGGPNFDDGVSVGPGSFTVNGTTINVTADDTISAVLGRITAATDVTASFNAASDSVEFTQKTAGAEHSIILGADTSGFLAAVKLDTATLRPGDSGEHTLPIDDVASLDQIRPGRFWVNDTRVRRIEPATESLADVLGLIDDVDGVSAGYLLSRDRVVVQGSGDLLHLDDPRTRFFSTVGIVAQEYHSARETGLGNRQRRDVSTAVSSMVRDVTKLLELSGAQGAGLAGFESSLEELLDSMDSEGALRAIGIGRRLPGRAGLQFNERDVRQLERALRRDPDAALSLLFGDGEDELGLVPQLAQITEAAISIADHRRSL